MNKLILVVDDNPDNSTLAKKILSFYGYDVFIAETGEKALNICKNMTPDLIFMDISLPDMNGYEVTSQIRKYPGFEKIPIIAFTAHIISDEKEKLLAAGMNSYLNKPITIDELKRTVEEYLNGR